MNKTGTQTLETHRLILRPFKIEDADEMFNNWASDPEVTRFLTWPTHSSVDVTRMVLNDWISHYEDGAYFNWAIELRETGSVIGNIAVVQLREDIEQVEIGYCMSRAFWGQGIMPEAFRAVMEYLFTVEGVIDLCAYGLVRSEYTPPEHHEPVPVTVRFAREADLPTVNLLRREVNDLHVAGKPDVFKPGFCDELRDHLFTIWNDPGQEIVVAEADGKVCGFAILHHINRPENPFMFERDFLDIDEFCVDENFRRQGVASAMIRFILDFVKEKGFKRLELNMWEFNRGALAFYEAAGFKTFRRYMEIME